MRTAYIPLHEVRCWVAWRLSHGTVRSQLGTVALPEGQTGYSRESRLVWYLDTQHRLARLDAQSRRILLLAALGHTQLCIAEQIGYSLRSTVRLFAEAAAALAALERRDRARRYAYRGQTKMIPLAHPSEADVQSWMQEPRCQCWQRLPGRPGPRVLAGPTLAAQWAGKIESETP